MCARSPAKRGAAERTVCLLEAGPDYGPRAEGRWPADILDPRALAFSHDWGVGGEDNRSLGSRIVGGSSAHNACMVIWGAPSDYDEWGDEMVVRVVRAVPRAGHRPDAHDGREHRVPRTAARRVPRGSTTGWIPLARRAERSCSTHRRRTPARQRGGRRALERRIRLPRARTQSWATSPCSATPSSTAWCSPAAGASPCRPRTDDGSRRTQSCSPPGRTSARRS